MTVENHCHCACRIENADRVKCRVVAPCLMHQDWRDAAVAAAKATRRSRLRAWLLKWLEATS